MSENSNEQPIYGLLAEFSSAGELVTATRAARKAGFTKIDAYSPLPLEELFEALGLHKSRLPLIVLIGGIVGACAGYGLAYWTSVIDYPINVGGRPFHSWPAFIPITFETTVLFAAFSAVLGMLALNGLPQLYHPVFNVSRFAVASKDRFFLLIEAVDPEFDYDKTWSFLTKLEPRVISDVEH